MTTSLQILFCPACGQRLAAGHAVPCPACGLRFPPPAADTAKPAGRAPGLRARFCLRANPWPLIVLALAVPVGFFWVDRSPTVAMVGLAYCDDFCSGVVLFVLLVGARAVQLLMRSCCETRYGVPPGAFRSRQWFWPWLLVIGVGTCLMVEWQVPMRLSFRMSRRAMDRIADEALADPANASQLAGRWAGLYRVAGVEVISGTVVLYLDKDGGVYGFARVPGAATDVIFNDPGLTNNAQNHGAFPKKSDGFHDPHGKRIKDDWFVMYSGYWLVKVGWS